MEKYKYRNEFPALMAEGAPEQDVLQDQYDLLCDLWHKPANAGPDKFGNLCFRRKGTTKMIDKFVLLREEMRFDRLLRRFDRRRYDQYFSPNVYARPSRKVGGVLMTRLGWCDVDEADPFTFDPMPSVVWETSPGNTQALWFWDRLHTPVQAQAFSKALAYHFGGDRGGNAPNKLLRLPGSFNHKLGYETPFIPLVHFDPRPIKARPSLLEDQDERNAGEPESLEMNPDGYDRLSVWRKYRTKLKVPTGPLLRHDRVQGNDRSRSIFLIVAGLHEVGASLDEIAGAVWTSPYFRDKYGDDRKALKTEVSRIISRVGAAR